MNGKNRERRPHPNQIPRPEVYAEVVVVFKPGASPDGEPVRAFRRATFSLTGTPTEVVLTISETTGDKTSHTFHFGDVAELKSIPTNLEVVDG